MRKVTNRTMTLYHVTRKENWFPVQVLGLIADFGESKKPSVFLVSRSRIPWAIKHISKRDGVPQDEYIIVTVHVRRSKLSRLTWPGCKRGLWRHSGDICPCKIDWVDSYPEKTLAAFLPEGVDVTYEDDQEGNDDHAEITW